MFPGRSTSLFFFAQRLEGAEKREHLFAQPAQLIPEEKFYVHEHLVVAGAAGMDFLACLSELAREHELNLRVDVLDVVLKAETAVIYACADTVEGGVKLLKFVLLQQSYAAEHPNMRLRAQDVVSCESHVEDAVVSDREILHRLGG